MLKFSVKVEITEKSVLVNGVYIMPSYFPRDMRQCSGQARIPEKDQVFRSNLIRKRLKEIGFTNIPRLRENSSFETVIEGELYVAFFDPHFIGCDPVNKFESVCDDEFVSPTYREVYFITLKNHYDIPVTKENLVR